MTTPPAPVAGVAAAFACFAFFPGLPHVIDWGAVIASLAVGGLARRARQSHVARKHTARRQVPASTAPGK
ncbi:hypothetical protein AB0O22_07945 [Streptomyces sp. NPDC091204]|uniref:hypothetical protein n=1 Tax=Streptomyces sp. NPDC091204 TaxID=3155299 RepID=UPI00341B05B7